MPTSFGTIPCRLENFCLCSILVAHESEWHMIKWCAGVCERETRSVWENVCVCASVKSMRCWERGEWEGEMREKRGVREGGKKISHEIWLLSYHGGWNCRKSNKSRRWTNSFQKWLRNFEDPDGMLSKKQPNNRKTIKAEEEEEKIVIRLSNYGNKTATNCSPFFLSR